MMAKRVYGIDLGTTYSCISYVDEHGIPIVVPNAEGDLTTPSVVFFESPENVVVGKAAKAEAEIHKDRVISTIKRRMGDPEEITIDGISYKPQEISAKILQKLVKDAAQQTGDTIAEVVITCPAYFGVKQKEATQQAGEIAGLKVLSVIPEPTAAAIAYGMQATENQNILVYDLGGGTFDITLIKISADEITVIATGGDDKLGGKDWDDDIVDYLANAFYLETSTPKERLTDDLETYQELLKDAEELKVRLTSANSVRQRVRFEAGSATVELTREKFDDITRHLLDQTVSFTEEMLARASDHHGINRIDKLLLVGGSTYMPQVIDRMKAFAKQSKPPFEVLQFDPNQAVAKGAAIFGHRLSLEQAIKIRVGVQTGQNPDQVDLANVSPTVKEAAERDVAAEEGMALPGLRKLVRPKITNVTAKSFGVVVIVDPQTRHEGVSNLVKIDDQVPRKISRQYPTSDEGQTAVDLRVMQNDQRTDRVELSLCDPIDPIGTAVIEFGRPLPQGSMIEVTFELAQDGRLSLHGRDLTTGNEIQANFETKGAIMSKEEVAEARSRALAMNVS